MSLPQCVQCGYCCTSGACSHGEWDADKHQCKFLTDDRKCAKYADIVASERTARYPMFGVGCSSSMFNTVREAKIRSDRAKQG